MKCATTRTISANRVYLKIMLKIIQGDSLNTLKEMESEFVDCVITSPPYWMLRDYGIEGQLGLEETPEEYIKNMVDIFREVKRVLKKEGTLWLNIGDSYASGGNGGQGKKQNSNRGTRATAGKRKKSPSNIKSKDLVGIPWMLAFALRADGWYLRQDIIWHKPNPMPESVRDRCTKAHEYIFLMSKSSSYYFDNEAIKEPASTNSNARVARALMGQKSNPDLLKNGIRPRMPQVAGHSHGKGSHDTLIHGSIKSGRKIALAGSGIKQNSSFEAILVEMVEKRNKRSVWSVGSRAFKEAHFATFPEKLIEPMILAGCPRGGVVLDPFMGAGTTLVVSAREGRDAIGIELNPEYIKITEKRLNNLQLPLPLI